MIVRFFAVIAIVAALASCSHRKTSARNSARQPGALPPAMYRQVVNAVNAGDGDYEIRVLRAKVAADAGDLKSRLELARKYSENGFPELAVEHSRLAAERFPSSPEAQISLARSLRAMGQAKQGATVLEKHLAAGRPSPADLYSWLGILRDDLKDYTAAEQAHRKAVDLSPKQDGPHNNLGYNLLLQGRNPEAAAEFRKALELNPHSETARNNLGLALANNPKEAILAWESSGDPASAHNNMAAVLMEQGKYQEARKELEIALRYKRDHPAAIKNISLLSQTGTSVNFPHSKPPESLWKRMKHVVSEAVLGPDAAPKTGGTKQTASR